MELFYCCRETLSKYNTRIGFKKQELTLWFNYYALVLKHNFFIVLLLVPITYFK